jgi:hypothetical protein
MTARFLHPSGTAPGTAQAEALPSEDELQPPTVHGIDWRGARLAGRACCCSAKPTIIAVMPSTASRPHSTDLLLCAHHYRASRHALETADATVVDLAGRRVTGNLWSAYGI